MAHAIKGKLKKGLSPWSAAFVGCVALMAALLLWQTMLSVDHASLQGKVALQASNASERVHEQMQERKLALQRMAKRWASAGGTPLQHWEADAWAYYNDFPGLQAVQWVDPTLRIRWVVPLQGNEAAVGFDMGTDERRRGALLTARDTRQPGITRPLTARDTRQPGITRPLELAVGGKGLLVFVPLYVGQRFDGFVVGVFRIESLLEAFLDPGTLNGYNVALLDVGETIYSSPGADKSHEQDYGVIVPLDLGGNAMELLVWPQPITLDAQRTILPTVTLAVGTIFALLLGLAVYFAQAARHRARSVAWANRALTIEVAERKRAEAALQQERDFNRMVLDTMGQGLTVVGEDGRFDYVNPAYADMLGYRPEQLIGRSPHEFTYTDDLSVLEEAGSRRARGEKSTYETKLKRADGTTIHAHITGAPHLRNGRVAGSITVITDLSERKRLEQALRELSNRDELTALLNRRGLNAILQEEVARKDQYGCLISLVLLDVDHFKKINDTYGHQVGDEVLRWIARLVAENLRPEDRLARFGGEEFAVVLPETSEQDACSIAERLRALVAVTDFVLPAGVSTQALITRITVSAGVAAHYLGESAGGLISRADKALYEAKRSGRNQVAVARPRVRERKTNVLLTSI